MALAKLKTDKSADAFRSIGEAASELGVQTHVIRYWETKFPGHVKPLKRRDGRRFFKPEDLEALRAIQALVHVQGMTLKGARTLLEDQGIEAVLAGDIRLAGSADDAKPSPAKTLQDTVRAAFDADDETAPALGGRERLAAMLEEMTDIKSRLDAVRGRAAA
ncbi:MAG: MerR family transcriptional regulator [Pseudomonadota bacterium]